VISLALPPGLRVGHWTDAEARTGCTVVLFPDGTVASAEVRGGAPASRELDLLDPQRTVTRIDAALLTGGSAFGLAAADGVMRFCEERGMGFPTAAGPVPIVPALAIFDLLEGDATGRPDAVAGYAACEAAHADRVELGLVGAGTGATLAKWRGREHARLGGIGGAVVRDGDLFVLALVVVNAFGDLLDGPDRDDVTPRVPPPLQSAPDVAFGNTTIGVLVTNGILTKGDCLLVAQSGHDGMARALSPAHTTADGDALIAAATGELTEEAVGVEAVRALAAAAVERAIRTAPPPAALFS
jgi:L-aminopeptidase/D-esterase-like protein